MNETINSANQDKPIDLIGIGNAIVDIIVNVDDEFLEKKKLQKGSMNLVDSIESKELLKECQIIKRVSGGSCANTVVSLASFGNKVEFIGRVKNDNFGEFFSSDLKESGAIFNVTPTVEGESSAHSIILVTPDAQRTMCTYLGASVAFEPDDVDLNSIEKSKYLYLEGYLWDNALAKKAFLESAIRAVESGTKIILSLSDSFCVERHRDSFIDLIDKYVDILFCNEEELKSLCKKDNIEDCKNICSSICPLIIVTLGNKGSYILNEQEMIHIEPKVLGEIIDTTGAGDIYAGGFIHGLINNMSLTKCGNLGSFCAGHIITQLGSRSTINLGEFVED